MKVNRNGVTRTVFLVGKYAVKIPSLRGCGSLDQILAGFCRGVLANASEREWSGSPGTCPVLWSFLGLVNVYPRCAPVIEDDEAIDFEAIGFLGPMDQKAENLGWLDGKMVWVDYDMSWNDCVYCGRHRNLVGVTDE